MPLHYLCDIRLPQLVECADVMDVSVDIKKIVTDKLFMTQPIRTMSL